MTEKAESVFISYRRQTSKYPALLVYKALRQFGYDVFIDYESIDSGKFAVEILHQIASRSHFVVILSPDCLNRTTNPEDWLRKEIEYAIHTGRNIVPLLFDGFSFATAKKYLTGDLSTLDEFNGLSIPDGYFDDAMRKLKDRFLKQAAQGALKPAPPSDSTFVQKTLQKANQAAQQETSLDAFSKYLEKSSTGESKLLGSSAQTPATKAVLGRDPIPDEFIEFDETFIAPKGLKSSLRRDRRLIITNERIILRDLDNASRSIKISRSILSVSNVTYVIVGFLEYELRIETGRKNYSIPLASGMKARVEQLIPARARWS
jgi:hypothetical protein